MKLNNGSLCFGSIIEKGGGTPSWSTDLGERRPDLKITYEGCDNILKGMDYKSIPLFAVACNLGKGGALNIGSQSPLFRKAALFEKVFINNVKNSRTDSYFFAIIEEVDELGKILSTPKGILRFCKEDNFSEIEKKSFKKIFIPCFVELKNDEFIFNTIPSENEDVVFVKIEDF